LRLCNFATGHDRYVLPEDCDVLDIYSAWRTIRDAARLEGDTNTARMRKVTRALCADGFLRRSDQPANPAEASMSKLGAWNPAAGFFHCATRNVRFSSWPDACRDQRAVAEAHPWPGATYIPPAAVAVRLPSPGRLTPVAKALLKRRTWRRFARAPLRLQDLASLLWITGGVQKWATTELGEFALKTSPSGGSLHPIELYVLARRVERLGAGFYHYSGADHRLRRLTRHDRAVRIEQYLPQQPWFEDSAAIVFLVAHYERYLWKYDYPRAYRAPFIEAGHLAQTFCVKATELGLAPFVSMALSDRSIEQEIGADGTTRSVLYAAGVGLRPAGMSSAPAPEGMSQSRIRTNILK
jgi:SagB-type dehydrogenase family enzyme